MPRKSVNDIPECLKIILDNLNTEGFINAIESRPAIWDSSTPEYSNSIATEKAWVEICTEFDAEFNSREIKEKNAFGKQLHRCWKSLRDCYRRELQKQLSQKSGSAAIGRKCYVYFEQLRFLQTVCTPTQSGLGEIENESPDMQNQQLETEELVETDVPLVTAKKRPRKCKEDDAELIKILKQKVAQEASNDRDSDTLFMLSLVPELKKVPENKRLIIKTQIMSTILQAQQASTSTIIAPVYSARFQQSAMQARSQTSTDTSSNNQHPGTQNLSGPSRVIFSPESTSSNDSFPDFFD